MDFHKAQHYFKLAADQGYLRAQVNLLQVSAILEGKVDPDLVVKINQSVQQQFMHPIQ